MRGTGQQPGQSSGGGPVTTVLLSGIGRGFGATLKERITDDMKAAMRAGEKERLGVIRMITSAIKQREVDERISWTMPRCCRCLKK